MTLTAQERKERPLAKGVLDYFPDALMEVAHASFVGNEQHHPGEPLHWDMSKSTDEADALLRHLKDRGTFDTDGVRHSAKVAWRALANLQREIMAEREAAGDTEVTVGEDLMYQIDEEMLREHQEPDIEQLLVDDSQTRLAEQVAANINGLTDYTAPLPWAEMEMDVDHGSDNGELPQPHGSRPSHYEGDFGVMIDDNGKHF